MRKEKKYHGIVVPMITPVTEKGRIDEGAVEKIIAGFVSAGVFPFIIGTTGESSSIPESEKIKFVECAGENFREQTTLYAGISGNSLQTSIDAAKKYFDLGVDVVVANLPSYYKLTEMQMLNYFIKLVENIPGPLIVYNITATTHMSIPLSVVDTLSEHPRVVGFKDSERDEKRLHDSISRYKEREDFSYLIGWAAQSLNGLKAGADGLVPSSANIAPLMYKELYDAVLKEDYSRAAELQEITDNISKIYQKDRTLGESLAGLKIMMNEAGLCGTNMLPPLSMLDGEADTVIRAKMGNLEIR